MEQNPSDAVGAGDITKVTSTRKEEPGEGRRMFAPEKRRIGGESGRR